MTELQKQKRQWLFHAKSAQKKLFALQSVRKQEEHLLQQIQSFGDCDELIQRVQELRLQTQHQLASLLSLREEITQQIETVPDMELQALLIRHYFMNETMEQIADAMFYDLRTIQRKHLTALDALDIQVSLLAVQK